MIKKKDPDNYVISQLQMEKKPESFVLKWKFREGDGFLLAISVYGRSLELTELCRLLQGKERELLDKKSLELGGIRILTVTADEFLVNEKRYGLNRKYIMRGVPCRISIYPYQTDGNEINLYEVDPKENEVIIPVWVNIQVNYTKPLFSRKRRCVIRIQQIEDYVDGAILYRPGNSTVSIPITQFCLNRDLIVYLPPEESVEFKIDPAYKSCYKIKLV